MSKKIVEIIKKRNEAEIAKHMPAKDAPVLSDEEKSDLDEFIDAFEAYWIDSRDTSRNIETDGFHASSLGVSHGKCARRNVYLLKGVAKQNRVDHRVMRVFANGHAVHERLQTAMEAMGIDMISEVPVRHKEPPIRGHADGTAVWKDRKILIEIKSCSDEVFVNRLKWKKPKDDHFDQCNIYAYILGYDVIWIIYENKNNQQVKIFEKKADPTGAEKIIDAWHAQWLCFKDDKLPKRPYKPTSPVCGGCDLKYHCFADADMGVDLKPYRETVVNMKAKSCEDVETAA